MSREPRYVDARFASLYLNTTACKQIKFMPTAQDVVKVVRCKDCKYRNKCLFTYNHRFRDDDYCSYGKRKGGEEE